MTYFVNFAGNPAASVPAGLAEGRYPVGMQLIGRRWADADVLAASGAFERLRPWRETYRLCRERGVDLPGQGGVEGAWAPREAAPGAGAPRPLSPRGGSQHPSAPGRGLGGQGELR